MIKHRLAFSAELVRTRPSACTALQQLRSVHHLVLSDRQAILAEFQLNSIGDECNNKHLNWQDVVLGQVEAFLITLNRACIGQLEDRVCSDPMMQEVMKYLDERFMETPSLEEVSDHFSLSSCGLSRRFKKYAGIGFRQYLIHRRMVEAKKMLEETDMKVTSIAYNVGFDSISSFNRDFHTLMGIAPAEYRRLSRGNRVKEL
jgi:AraC-like DNA-binding protein